MRAQHRAGNGNGKALAAGSFVSTSMLDAYNDLAGDVRRIHRTDHPATLRRRAKRARLMAAILEELARDREQEVSR